MNRSRALLEQLTEASRNTLEALYRAEGIREAHSSSHIAVLEKVTGEAEEELLRQDAIEAVLAQAGHGATVVNLKFEGDSGAYTVTVKTSGGSVLNYGFLDYQVALEQ